jgi:hypothetical protein
MKIMPVLTAKCDLSFNRINFCMSYLSTSLQIDHLSTSLFIKLVEILFLNSTMVNTHTWRNDFNKQPLLKKKPTPSPPHPSLNMLHTFPFPNPLLTLAIQNQLQHQYQYQSVHIVPMLSAAHIAYTCPDQESNQVTLTNVSTSPSLHQKPPI